MWKWRNDAFCFGEGSGREVSLFHFVLSNIDGLLRFILFPGFSLFILGECCVLVCLLSDLQISPPTLIVHWLNLLYRRLRGSLILFLLDRPLELLMNHHSRNHISTDATTNSFLTNTIGECHELRSQVYCRRRMRKITINVILVGVHFTSVSFI